MSEKKVLSVEEIAKLLHKTQWGYFNAFLNFPEDYSNYWDSLPVNFKNLYIHQAVEILLYVAQDFEGFKEYKILLEKEEKRINKVISD